ncbi:MAG TPA: hypothetical protein VJ436_11305 [Anaerolineales bacterium]|nr:hypothetical protein [Anaerolineales bacterium]
MRPILTHFTLNNPNPIKRQRSRFAYLAWPILTLTLLAVFNLTGQPLLTPAAPAGILSFEFAGSLARAQEILQSWNEQARLLAAFSLGLDYLFMFAYASTIAAGCLWAGATLLRRGWPLSVAGRPLAWAQWAAALFDAVENLGLTLLLLGQPAATWPALAAWAAGLKFTLIGLGLVYSAYGALAWLASRLLDKGRDEAGLFT